MTPTPGAVAAGATDWEALLAAAAPLWRRCAACAHRCGVDRFAGERGLCGAGPAPAVYNEVVQLGEEIDLVPTYLVLFSACDLRCAYCSEGPYVDDPRRGVPIDGDAARDALVARIRAAAAAPAGPQRARFVTFVGGEVTVHLDGLLRLLRALDGTPPAVLVTNLHATPEALRLLLPAVHAFVADLKFGPDGACARAVARVDDYWPVVTANLAAVAAAGRPLTVRHLLMPGHVACCAAPALAHAGALARAHPCVRANLMFTYQPLHRAARDARLGRPPSPAERAEALALARAALPSGRLLIDGVPA
ncbi:MAG TPA: radical SAM protein [Myxococcota bacterium]|jgi:putative pyruvate formate lyase activating enzyme|nr:radical SAM protein [Myxococcota bacterium]